MRQIIWSSEAYIDEEARARYEAQQREFLEDEGFKVSDTEWAEVVNSSLSDERANLNKPVNGIIIAFADLGLWKGRRQGYRILGRKVRDIFLTAEENNEWYGDGFNIRGELSHHDGTHHILYRVARDQEHDAFGARLCSRIHSRDSYCSFLSTAIPEVIISFHDLVA